MKRPGSALSQLDSPDFLALSWLKLQDSRGRQVARHSPEAKHTTWAGRLENQSLAITQYLLGLRDTCWKCMEMCE